MMNDSEPQPEEQQFDFEQLQLDDATIKPTPKPKTETPKVVKSFAKGVFRKIGIGILCSLAATFITNSVGVFQFVTTACAAIGVLGGDNARSFTDKISGLLDKAGKVAPPGRGAREPDEDEEERPTFRKKFENKVKGNAVQAVKAKVEDKVEEVKEEAQEKVTEVKQEAHEKVEEVKETVTRAVNRIGTAGRSVGGRVVEGGDRPRSGWKRPPAVSPSSRSPSSTPSVFSARTR